MSSASPATIIQNAAADINAVAMGEALSPEHQAVGFSHFNRLLGQWKTRRVYAFFVQSQAFAWGTTKASYTIGPSGADFTITGDRPVYLESAKLVLTTSTPNGEIPLEVYNAKEFARINTPGQQSTLPEEIWYQPTYPNGTIFPWPQPTNTSYKLKLYWWNQLNEIAAGALFTAISWPPGMEDAITWTLSERLCIPFGKTASPDLKEQARQARGFIQSLNSKVPRIGTDYPSSTPSRGLSLSGFLSRGL